MRLARSIAVAVVLPLSAPAIRAQSPADTARPRVTKSAPVAGATPAAPSGARGPAAPSSATNFSGLYRATQVNGAGTCTPQPLPPPAPTAGSDTTAYAPGAASLPDTMAFWARLTQQGSSIMLVPSEDSLGRNAAPPIPGTLRPDGRFTSSRMLTLGPEGGPRQGGRRFFVEQESTSEGRLESTAAAVRLTIRGSFTHRFRVDSASGAVYTACTQPFTGTATRVSQ